MFSELPLISVVIPAFNRERHLRQCLSSVLSQSYSHLEAIVVDDGSTDGTPALMEELQKQDARVRYLRKPNGGVSSARNVGIRSAQGELIALLDSDDAWYPWKLEIQQAVLQALPDVGMVWTDMTAINEQGVQLYERYLRRMYGSYKKLSGSLFEQSWTCQVRESLACPYREIQVGYGEIYPQMLRGNLVHTSTVLIRKERALQTGLFDESYRRAGEDFGFHLRTCRSGPVALVDIPSTLYRIGAEDALTHQRYKLSLSRAFLQTITDEIRDVGDRIPLNAKEVNSILSDAHSWLGAELLTERQHAVALSHLLKAIQLDITSHKAWRQLARIAIPGPVRQALKRVLLRQPTPALTKH